MAWLARGDFTGSDYVQASDLNNLHNDDVTWGGNVNGGGYTLSNVILEGVVTQSGASGVSSFNTRIGAVVSQSGDYTAAMVGAVPTSLQILTPPGSGLSGGGPLTGNLSLSAAMVSFNARVGVITLTPADISGAMGVLQSRAITAGAGLQGGGNLAQDVPLSVIPGDPTQQIQFIQGGLAVATRHAVNFVSGANVNVAVADNSPSGRVDVTISSTGGGSGMVDPTTTKGDVIVRGPSITSRLAVGADGQVLTADSTQSLGLKWGAASGSGAVASVFGRTGAVVAATGDYSAAQVTNAVDRSQTYSDPMWLIGLNWSKILATPSFLLDPTTTKGDLVVHGASAISRLAVGGDGAILVADSTQALGVRWGASLPSSIPAGQFAGDMLIWQQAGGWGLISAAGQPAAVGNVLTVQSIGASTKLAWQAPPPSQATLYWVNGTQVQSSFGVNFVAGNNTTIAGAMDGSGTKVNITITAGGPTSGLADPTTTKGDLIARATAQVTRLPVGTDGTILMADSTQALGVKWATVSGGGGGGAQTPWTSNIDAAGFTLNNIPVIQAPASNNNLILNAPGDGGSISLQADGTTMVTIDQTAGLISWGSVIASVNAINGNPPSVVMAGFGEAQWSITGTSSPTTPGTNLLTFQCLQQTAGIYTMNDLGYFGVGVAAPAHAVDAAGDCNITGLYRIHGAALAAAQVVNAVSTIGSYADPAWITSLAWSKITGAPGAAFYQTPWLTDIVGGGFALSNVRYIAIGSGAPQAAPSVGLSIQGNQGVTSVYVLESSTTGYSALILNASVAQAVLALNGGATSTDPNYLRLTNNTAGIIFSTSGAERGRLSTAGNFGIGTVTPTRLLEVFGPVTGVPVARFGNANQSVDVGGYESVSNSAILNCSGGGLALQTHGTNRLVIAYAGNVGIGTATPVRPLHVGGVIAGSGVAITGAAPSLAISNADTEPNSNTMGFIIGFATAAGNYGVSAGDTVLANQGSARGNIYLSANYAGGGAAKSVFIQPAGGAVGIGTVNPLSTLHVHSGADQNILIGAMAAYGAGVVGFSAVNDANNAAIPMVYAASWHAFSSFVGIQTTSPGAALDVNGNAIVRGGNCTLFATSAKATAGSANLNYTSVGDGGAPLQAFVQMVCDPTATNRRLTLGCVDQGIAWRNVTLCETAGNVGVGLATPTAKLHVLTTYIPPSLIHGAGSGFALAVSGGTELDISLDNAAGYPISLQARNNSADGYAYPLCLNPLGGGVGIGTTTIRAGSALSIIAGSPTTVAAATQFVIGESSNNPAYQMSVGFAAIGGTWSGILQALNNGAGSPIYLNPTAGNVGIGPGITSPPALLSLQKALAPTEAAISITANVAGATVSSLQWLHYTAVQSGAIKVNANTGANFVTSMSFEVNDGAGTHLEVMRLSPAGANVVGALTVNGVPVGGGSDLRLKQNIRTLEGGMSVIERLRPIRGEWNGLAGRPAGESLVSVIAQELQEVEPDAVYSFPGKLHPEDTETVDLLGVHPMALVGHLILAVQQLSLRLKALEGKN